MGISLRGGQSGPYVGRECIGTAGWLSKPRALRARVKRSESDSARAGRRKPRPTLAMDTAFKSEDRDMLYNLLINRGEFIEKPKLEREIDILTKKINNLNQNIDEAKKILRLNRGNTSGANISS